MDNIRSLLEQIARAPNSVIKDRLERLLRDELRVKNAVVCLAENKITWSEYIEIITFYEVEEL